GNLQSEKSNIINRRKILFGYHESKLFFGYTAIQINSDARKIKSINEIQKLNLDEKKMTVDQELFVKEDFSVLVEEVQPIAKEFWKDYSKKHLLETTQLLYGETPIKIRKALRRIQMLFANTNETQNEQLFAILYSPIYPKYLEYRKNDIK